MIKQTRNKKALSINIVVFGVAGFIYYLIFLMEKLGESLDHPIIYGWVGIWIPIVGVLSIYDYYNRGYLFLYKNSLVAIFYSLLYFLGFFIAPAILGIEQEQFVAIWLGLILVFYFVTIGALHWYSGFYIALFNIAIFILAITGNTGDEINPIVWVNILSLAGINNTYLQWGIVLASAILGLLEKGHNIFEIYDWNYLTNTEKFIFT